MSRRINSPPFEGHDQLATRCPTVDTIFWSLYLHNAASDGFILIRHPLIYCPVLLLRLSELGDEVNLSPKEMLV